MQYTGNRNHFQHTQTLETNYSRLEETNKKNIKISTRTKYKQKKRTYLFNESHRRSEKYTYVLIGLLNPAVYFVYKHDSNVGLATTRLEIHYNVLNQCFSA